MALDRGRPPAARDAQRVEQDARVRALVDDGGGARLERALAQVVARVDRVHHDGGGGGLRAQLAADLQAVLLHEVAIEDHDVGTRAPQQPPETRPVLRAADRREPRLRTQDRLEAGAHHRVVVDDQDADHTGSLAGARAPVSTVSFTAGATG